MKKAFSLYKETAHLRDHYFDTPKLHTKIEKYIQNYKNGKIQKSQVNEMKKLLNLNQ